ncbi:hypothetical protein ACG98H_09775 [Corynebacterium sp. L4756]|uniref:hypothetical protein n=1 Tax=unclassified Corynebacterium TaxID=2624378 RepID=UPI00374D8636
MSDHSLSSSRRLNKLAAACLSISLATGTVYATSTSAPVAFAQDAETGDNDSDNGGNDNDNGNDADAQPEESSLSNSSVATDEESALAKVVNSLSLILAVGGIAGAMVSLIAHFAAMALPSVPWQN